MTDFLTAALEYGARGWRVMPVPLGRKHPSVHGWQDRASSDPAEIRRLFARPWAMTKDGPKDSTEWQGISIATGEASGIWVLDVDVSEGKHGDESLADLESQYGQLPDTYEVVTGRGGRHLYFRWDADYPVTSSGGVLGPGLDVRGVGGQVLAPPSRSPEPGYELSPYTVELGGQDEPTCAPLWLLELLSRPQVTEPRRHRPEGTGTQPGDLYEAAHTWPEILEADGAHMVRVARTRDGLEYELWARPGRDGDSHGASLYYGGSDVLKVFTSSWPGLEEGRTYSRFGYYAATRHGGDHSAAARALREAGYTVEEVDRGNHSPEFGDFGEIRHSDGIPEVGEWPDPEPFPERETIPWPIETLPDFVKEQCEAVALKLQVPVDLCAQLAVGVMASVAQGKVKVEVHPGWQEHVNLYLVTAMPSGTGKSPAVKAMAQPVYELEDKLLELVTKEIRDKTALKVAAEAKAKQAEKSHAMGSIDPIEYLKIKAAADEIDVPPVPRLLMGDTTPEMLVMEMAEHDGRMSIISPEGAVFDMVQGAYAKKPNIGIYLEGWAGERHMSDRKGNGIGASTKTRINEALLTICVAVQPMVLEGIARDEVLSGRGFTARFMPSMPADLRGMRDPEASETAASPSGEYDRRLLAAGLRVNGWENPLILRLTQEARDLRKDWDNQVELRLHRHGDLRPVAEWTSKIKGSVVRLAGLFAFYGGQDEVTVEAMARAIRVGDYWMRQAIGLVTGLWEGLGLDTERAERVLRWVSNHLEAPFSIPWAELRRRLKLSADEAEEVFQDLLTYKWLLIAPVERVAQTGRPPKPDLVFHPKVRSFRTSALSDKSDVLSLSLSLSTTPPLEGGAETQKLPPAEAEGSDWEGII